MTGVVATAGHVDHGKSSLVRALTGMEPDRLEEEHRRGLSIELGYAWTTWPGTGDVAFVDVPGHRRFARTTLAGLGPVPVVLFVVAADEGWKPQSAEHLAALDALEVRHGVLTITKIDRADPARAVAEARRALSGTALAAVRAVPVCATDGTGVDALIQALRSVLAEVPPPDPAAGVRLWVDRSFTIIGVGQVITGTLPAGSIHVGDELVTSSGATVRVRGIESLGRSLEVASGTARVALNVRVRDGQVSRGEAVFRPGTHVVTNVLDAVLRGSAEDVPNAAVLHIGSAAVPCQVRPLGDRHVRLTLAERVPLQVGDRALVRDPGRPSALVGLSVVDVQPPALVGRGATARRAAELAAVAAPVDALHLLLRRGPVRTIDLVASGLPAGLGVEVVPGWRVSADRWSGLGAELRTLLASDLDHDPLGRPRTAASMAATLGLPDVTVAEALLASIRPDHDRVGRLPDAILTGLDQLDQWYADHPYGAPNADQLSDLGLDSAALAAAARAGRLLRLAPHVVLAPGADVAAVAVLASVPSPFRVTDACAALGATRRSVVPLLEHLDKVGRTRRLANGDRMLTDS
jgi:selenocysteine-specific elongation factor